MRVGRLVVQAHGFNGLSFRELAKVVGIKSASVHYHFPTKGDLGAALALRYCEEAATYFDNLLADFTDMTSCLTHYTNVFRAALVNDNRMCLCGIMAAEYHDLPDGVRIEVDRFTDLNVQWLVKVLSTGSGHADTAILERQAFAIFAAIEGAQLLARGRNDISLFDRTIDAYRTAGLMP